MHRETVRYIMLPNCQLVSALMITTLISYISHSQVCVGLGGGLLEDLVDPGGQGITKFFMHDFSSHIVYE